ncbi:MAG: hypothetical protein CL790_02560 [Chloroflexi bacterium]|nr:hypothetical protein [Chloroflexota bacterium]
MLNSADPTHEQYPGVPTPEAFAVGPVVKRFDVEWIVSKEVIGRDFSGRALGAEGTGGVHRRAFAGTNDTFVGVDADEDEIAPGGVDEVGCNVGDFHRDPAWRTGMGRNLAESGRTILNQPRAVATVNSSGSSSSET